MRQDHTAQDDVRSSNITAAKGISDLVRTSLGPRGMDKMIVDPNNDVLITNDGATIVSKLNVSHPAAKMLVELSKSQDIAAGDGTTSVVVLAGALLNSLPSLMLEGIHPTQISEAFGLACKKSVEILTDMANPIDIADKDSLLKSAITSLNSKVVSAHSDILAPLAVNAISQIIDPKTATNANLNDIRIVKKLGSTIEESRVSEGIIFNKKSRHKANGPNRIVNAKIGLIQFQLSPPKTDMDNQIVVNDYAQMDRRDRKSVV